jgi:hypothetical protein
MTLMIHGTRRGEPADELSREPLLTVSTAGWEFGMAANAIVAGIDHGDS